MASMDRTQRNLLPKKSHVTAFPILLSLVRKDILMKWAYLIQKEARLLFDTFSLTGLAAEVMGSWQWWWVHCRSDGFTAEVMGSLQSWWVCCRGDGLVAELMGWLHSWWVGCRIDGLVAEVVNCRVDGCRQTGQHFQNFMPVYLPAHSNKQKQIRYHRSSCGLHHTVRRHWSHPALSLIDQVSHLSSSFIASERIWAHSEIHLIYSKYRTWYKSPSRDICFPTENLNEHIYK